PWIEIGFSSWRQVHLDGAQHAKSRGPILLVEASNPPALLPKLVLVHAVRDGQSVRVVGDGEVAEAARSPGLRHGPDRRRAVASQRVHLQIATHRRTTRCVAQDALA